MAEELSTIIYTSIGMVRVPAPKLRVRMVKTTQKQPVFTVFSLFMVVFYYIFLKKCTIKWRKFKKGFTFF
jgi:hypothetical protein